MEKDCESRGTRTEVVLSWDVEVIKAIIDVDRRGYKSKDGGGEAHGL